MHSLLEVAYFVFSVCLLSLSHCLPWIRCFYTRVCWDIVINMTRTHYTYTNDCAAFAHIIFFSVYLISLKKSVQTTIPKKGCIGSICSMPWSCLICFSQIE